MAPSQERLTRILLSLAIAGSLVIAGLWRDSMRFQTGWRPDQVSFLSWSSSIHFEVWEDEEFPAQLMGFNRERAHPWERMNAPSFPRPAGGIGYLRLPYYLILLTWLSTLLLTWLLLMNRLARREAEPRSSERGS